MATLTLMAAQLGRKPGTLDHVSYFAADNSGVYVGDLNGPRISCITSSMKEYICLRWILLTISATSCWSSGPVVNWCESSVGGGVFSLDTFSSSYL